jgi:hypothetical protein
MGCPKFGIHRRKCAQAARQMFTVISAYVVTEFRRWMEQCASQIEASALADLCPVRSGDDHLLMMPCYDCLVVFRGRECRWCGRQPISTHVSFSRAISGRQNDGRKTACHRSDYFSNASHSPSRESHWTYLNGWTLLLLKLLGE